MIYSMFICLSSIWILILFDFGVAVKLIGKLQDGTVFVKKGYDDEEPFEFKNDEGKT